MRVLVTGGAGFIGSHLSENLLERGDSVVIIDDLNNYYNPKLKLYNLSFLKKAKFYNADIRNLLVLKKIMTKNKIDKIVHLAARAGVKASIAQPFLYEEVNVKGTLNLLHLAVKEKVKNFIFASSSSVYGKNKKLPFSEKDKTDSQISPYAATKKAGELLCHAYSHLYSMPITCLRFFTVYGPRGRPDMAVFKFIRLMSQNKKIPLYNYGKMSRDFTYIDDAVKGILEALDRRFDYEIFNLGNSKPVNLNYLVLLIEKNLGKKAKVKKLPMQEGDVPVTYADIKKAKKLLKWHPITSIEKGIVQTVSWFKSNKKFLCSL